MFNIQSNIPEKYANKIDDLISNNFNTEDFRINSYTPELISNVSLNGNLYTIHIEDEEAGYLYYNSINTCKLGGCISPSQVQKNGQYEFFDLAIILSKDWTIDEIKILKYYSEYGYEITSKKYLKKFYNKTPCDLKLNDDIDGISGATVSASSLMDEIHQLCLR